MTLDHKKIQKCESEKSDLPVIGSRFLSLLSGKSSLVCKQISRSLVCFFKSSHHAATTSSCFRGTIKLYERSYSVFLLERENLVNNDSCDRIIGDAEENTMGTLRLIFVIRIRWRFQRLLKYIHIYVMYLNTCGPIYTFVTSYRAYAFCSRSPASITVHRNGRGNSRLYRALRRFTVEPYRHRVSDTIVPPSFFVYQCWCVYVCVGVFVSHSAISATLRTLVLDIFNTLSSSHVTRHICAFALEIDFIPHFKRACSLCTRLLHFDLRIPGHFLFPLNIFFFFFFTDKSVRWILGKIWNQEIYERDGTTIQKLEAKWLEEFNSFANFFALGFQKNSNFSKFWFLETRGCFRVWQTLGRVKGEIEIPDADVQTNDVCMKKKILKSNKTLDEIWEF